MALPCSGAKNSIQTLNSLQSSQFKRSDDALSTDTSTAFEFHLGWFFKQGCNSHFCMIQHLGVEEEKGKKDLFF